MPKVIIICGKICSGKSTYADRITKPHADDNYVARTKSYLYKKSLEILDKGIDVVSDWGFWTQKEREYIKKIYTSKILMSIIMNGKTA